MDEKRTLDEQIADAISNPSMSPETQAAVEEMMRQTYAALVADDAGLTAPSLALTAAAALARVEAAEAAERFASAEVGRLNRLLYGRNLTTEAERDDLADRLRLQSQDNVTLIAAVQALESVVKRLLDGWRYGVFTSLDQGEPLGPCWFRLADDFYQRIPASEAEVLLLERIAK